MALLRVADYLQLDRNRAPAVLLQLRNPPSPKSVKAWKAHDAVDPLMPANDPRGRYLNVRKNLSLEVFLQIEDLLQGLQRELDQSTAVLDEASGNQSTQGLDKLNLAIRRVHSNIHDPEFRKSLPYVPKRTGFSADPHLLSLLVKPLYGDYPEVGVRELIQNATDAVRELEDWCKQHGVSADDLDLPDLEDADVQLDYIQRDDGSWFLRVQDRGIGMTADTIQNYFLRAGASFRRSPQWTEEHTDETGKPRVVRAGRFGVGAFAIFLLGSSFKLWTRHASAKKSGGCMIEVTQTSQQVEIQYDDATEIGTKIEIELDLTDDAVHRLKLNEYGELRVDWYCWDWPKVVQRIHREGVKYNVIRASTWPIRQERKPSELFTIYPDGFDAVHWMIAKTIDLSCNGIRIADPGLGMRANERLRWSSSLPLDVPPVAVADSAGNLPLRIQRYGLAENEAPFIRDLETDVLLSFIAHALVCGPQSCHDAISMKLRHPLSHSQLAGPVYHGGVDSPFENGALRWCATRAAFVPFDPWLINALKAPACITYGSIAVRNSFPSHWSPKLLPIPADDMPSSYVYVPWHIGVFESDRQNPSDMLSCLSHILKDLVVIGGPELRSAEPPVIRALLSGSLFERVPAGSKGKWASAPRVEYGGQDWLERSSPRAGSFDPCPLFEILAQCDQECVGHFVAEIALQLTKTPESLIAKLWNDCLGPTPIPFDPDERRILIDKGRKHPDLNRHIEAWERMKKEGSKWVT